MNCRHIFLAATFLHRGLFSDAQAGNPRSCSGLFVWLAVVVALTAGSPAAMADAEKEPKVEVELLADRTAGAPGETVELGVKFTLEPEWHIYWRNRGEGGMEPAFRWELPEGYKVGPMRFPRPQRHVDAADAHTFILEGEPVILTTLTVPASAEPGDKAEIGLKASWLVCREMCFLGDKDLSLTLPVVARAADAKPANEMLFRMARNDLPVPMNRTRHLKLSAAASVDKVKPGSEFKVAVVLDVDKGHHINAHKPLSEFLVPTDVFHDAVAGLEIRRPVFPAGTLEPSPLSDEKVAVYRGRSVIVLPVRADRGLAASNGDEQTVRISGVVTYQACNDETKMCFPPMAAEWALSLPLAGPDAEVTAANEKLFAEAGTTGTTPDAGITVESTGIAHADEAPGATAAAVVDYRTWLARLQDWLGGLGIAGYLMMAFAGGFILNLMPCVLPVISIKILSFVQQARESRGRVFTLGLAFSSGIVLSFLALGVLIVGLGQQWGGLFQRPEVVIGLAAVVLAFALSLFGVFTVFPPRVVNELGEKVPQEGHLGAFGMGLLATLLGTACTAPFLSVAVAFASQQPGWTGMLLFLGAGVGMAFPYVLLAAKPAWVRLVPRPGPWMKTFEHVMGLVLLGTVIWLLNTVGRQLGSEGLLWTLVFLLAVGVAVWIYGKAGPMAERPRRLAFLTAAALVIAAGWWLSFSEQRAIPELIARERDLRLGIGGPDWLAQPNWDQPQFPWVPYTRERKLQAVGAGYTVFVDYTAEWCANCKVNERLVIDTAPVRAAMQRLGVLPFMADFTSQDPEIAEDLRKYGRGGVPMYLVVPAGQPDRVMVLDEVLTVGTLIAALEQAGPSRTEDTRTAQR